MNNLTQKKNLVKREFRFTENKLFYSQNKFGNGNEIDIPFENIDGEKVTNNVANQTLLIISGIILFIAAMIQIRIMNGGKSDTYLALYWAIIGLIVLVAHIFSREHFWKIRLTNNTFIHIHKNIPNEEITDQFIADLMEARNKYLIENYFTIDVNLGYEDQLNNFKWLRGINAISKEEFDNKYEQLKQTVSMDNKNIGFGVKK